MSRHSTPASASARRMAIAPMSIPVRSAKRPNGCSPTPMIATSTWPPACLCSCRSERERHDVVAIAVRSRRHQYQLHVHADPKPLGLRQARLDAHLAAELHVTDTVRDEGSAG